MPSPRIAVVVLLSKKGIGGGAGVGLNPSCEI
jgi:hypothetical protein